MKLKKWFLVLLFLVPSAITNADQPRMRVQNPGATRALETLPRFRVPPRPENYWEGAWCYRSGYRDSHTVAAFNLDGDRHLLSADGYHPNNSVFLFVSQSDGSLRASEEENVRYVAWDEGGSGTFRMAFYQPETRAGFPDLTYVDLLASIDGAYGSTQAKRVHYVKARNIDACLRTLNNLEPCECSIK